MRKGFVQISGVPASPVIIGGKAVIFHGGGYARTGTVLSVYHSPMGAYLLVTEDTVYWITPGGPPEAAQCAFAAFCA